MTTPHDTEQPLVIDERPWEERPWEDDSVEVAWVARRADHISKVVKGLLVALAAAIGLELTTDAGAAALVLAGAVLAILAANVYADAVQHEIRLGKRLDRRGLRDVALHSMGVPIGALPAFTLFAIAWLGFISVEVAIDISVWSGMLLLLGMGYVSGRLQGESQRRAVGHGAILAAIGLGVMVLKSLH